MQKLSWPLLAVIALIGCRAPRPDGAGDGTATAQGWPTATTKGACVGAGCDDAGAVEAGATCQAGLLGCGGSCVDVSSNVDHCGACDARCSPSQQCYMGVCTAGCPSGTVVCEGKCIEPNADPTHCGATAGCGADGGTRGETCGPDGACYGGQCVTDCGDRLGCVMPSGTVCVDVKTDSANCGGCGQRCAGGTVCSQGTCCPPQETACMGTCRNLKTSAGACGGCGSSCAPGQTCTNGACGP